MADDWKQEYSESLLIRFSDTGTAIEDELLPQLFEMFTSKSANDATTQGVGLGLYICKAVVDAHGGTISARNNPEGPGAIFDVSLPIYALRDYSPRAAAAFR